MKFRHDIGQLSLPGRYAHVQMLLSQGFAQGKQLFEMIGLFDQIVAMALHFGKRDEAFLRAYQAYFEKLGRPRSALENLDEERVALLALIEEMTARYDFWSYEEVPQDLKEKDA